MKYRKRPVVVEAVRWWPPGDARHVPVAGVEKGPREDQPWGVMSFAVRGDRVAFASEGVDGGEWTRLSPPETISAVPKGSAVEVRRRALTLKSPFGPVPEVTRS